MSKKYSSESAFYDRMRTLAKVDEGKENKAPNTLGNLIDYKRGADNVAYGIVKENSNYFIKKSNKQADPNVEDFAYIGGLENIHEYRYNKLSEADKNRTMLLNTINEALGSKGNVISEEKSNNEKKNLNENAEEELAAAEEKLDNAEEKADAESAEEPESDVDLNVDAIDLPPEDNGEEGKGEEPETPAGNGGEEGEPEVPKDGEEEPEIPDNGGEDEEPETPAGNGGEEGESETPAGEDDEPEDDEQREIQKLVGKLTNKIRNTELTQNQIKSHLNSVVSSVEDELPELEVEDRKEIANKIMKVSPEGEEELSQTGVDSEEDEMDENKSCNECGFAKYADERGYDTESLMEASDDEIASLMNGYALEQEDEINEEDLQSMAVFSSPELEECLTNEYGNSTLPESMKQYSESMNEESGSEDKRKKVEGMFWWKIDPQKKQDTKLKTLSEEDISAYAEMSDDELAQLDEETLQELNLRGVGNVAKYLGQKGAEKAGAAAKGIEKGVKGAAGAVKGAIDNKIDQFTQNLDQLGDQISQEYYKADVSKYEKKLQKAAQEFGEFINKLDDASQKAGQGEINKHSIMMTLQGVLKGGKPTNETVNGNDPAAIEVQPNMNENEDYDEEQGEVPGEQDTGPDEYGNEEVNSKEEFEEYANTLLKQAHGEDFDPEKAEYMINGLVNMVKASEEEDWGAAVGILQQSLDESLKEQDEKEDSENNGDEVDDIEMTPGFDTMGGGVPKPDGAEVETEEIGGESESDFDIKDSTVNINMRENKSMSESERKLRKYIRARLEENAGIRKSNLNEDKKSKKMKMLDSMIDNQYDLFESIIKENGELNEIFDFKSKTKTFEDIDPNNEESIEKAFNKIFSDTLGQFQQAKDMAAKMTPEDKYKVMKQGMETDKFKNPKFGKRNGEWVYLQRKPGSDFKSGGTGGKTSGGGV